MSMAVVAAIGGVATVFAILGTSWLARLVRLDAVSFRYLMAIVYTDALLAIPYAHLRMTNRAMRYATLKITFVLISIALNVFLIGSLHWGVSAIFLSNLAANLLVLALFLGEIGRFFRPGLLRDAPWGALWAYALPVIPATLAVMVVEGGDRMSCAQLSARASRHERSTAWRPQGRRCRRLQLQLQAGRGHAARGADRSRLAWIAVLHAARARGESPRALLARPDGADAGLRGGLPCDRAPAPVARRSPSHATWTTRKTLSTGSGCRSCRSSWLGYVFKRYAYAAVVTAGLYIERKTHVLAWIAGAGAVLNMAICVVAAPRWGMVSVAWATPAAYGLMAALGAWQSNRVFPVPFEWGRLAMLAALVAVLFGIDYVTGLEGVAPLSVTGLMSKVGLLLALPGVLVAGGFFRHGEMRALRSMLSRS